MALINISPLATKEDKLQDISDYLEELKHELGTVIDEYEDDFGVVDNEIGFNDIDGDGLNNFEYDHLPNELMWSKEPCMSVNVTRLCKLVRMTWLRAVNC